MSSSLGNTNTRSISHNERLSYTTLIFLNGSFGLPMRDPTPIDPNDVETASMSVHVDEDTTYMEDLLHDPIDHNVGNSAVVEADDTILNGIHVEDIQPKDESVDDNVAMSLDDVDTK